MRNAKSIQLSALSIQLSQKVLCLFSIRRYIRFSNNALMLNNRINNALLNITIVIVVVIIIPALDRGVSCM